MSKLLIVIMAISLAGCLDGLQSEQDKTLTSYKCSVDQLDAVQKEFELCNESSYLSSYCYATAKRTQCTKIKESDNE